MSEQNKLQAQELATLLDVTPASLSGAAKKDHLCKGYPVAEWAARTPRGRVTGYVVPDDVYEELQEEWPEPGEQFVYENELGNKKIVETKKDGSKNIRYEINKINPEFLKEGGE